MQITVIIPDQLADQAQALGISIDTYVQSLVEEAQRRSLSSHRLRTPGQI
jgi:hypothetical protein